VVIFSCFDNADRRVSSQIPFLSTIDWWVTRGCWTLSHGTKL